MATKKKSSTRKPGKPSLIDVVIPYVTQTVVWDELKIAIRSMEKNFDFPFRLHLLAENLPDWASSKLKLIKCEQIKGFENAKAFDAASKMERAITSRITRNFIYTYDDIVFLNTISFDDLKFRWAHARLMNETNILSFSGGGRWKNVMINTLHRLQANKLPDYNYENHLPRVFDKKLMHHTIERFGFTRLPYAIPTIYFNFNFDMPEGIIGKDSPSLYIGKPITSKALTEIITLKKILTYNNAGLNSELKSLLLEMFPDKSSFES
jgi:hypothetical protein